MATTKEEIKEWFQFGIQEKATHMIIVCDTYEHADYPVYVSSEQNVHDVVLEKKESSMQRVMEVYNLSMDMETQLNKRRNFEY